MRTIFCKKNAGTMALALAALAPLSMHAQPMYDRIHVNLPYTVTLQNKTLQPGDYTIQQLPSTSGSSRILLFYTNDGLKFETSAMTIPALDVNTARDTKLILNHVGEDYYISKIWVQGKDYGYELPMPDSMKSRQNERMTEATLSGTNHPSSSAEMTTATADTAAAAPVTPVDTAPPANANSNNTADTANRPVADATTATPTPTAAVTQPAAQPAAANTSADRTMQDQNKPELNTSDQITSDQNASNGNTSAHRKSMPSTAADWLTMLLTGSVLSGAGLMLRRKR